MSETLITWAQRRGQIKHLLYELCLAGRIDKSTLFAQFYDLNNVEPIVRCKDCKRYTPFRNIQGEEMGEGECEGYDPCVPANYFCSRGERREDADSDTCTDDI